MSQIMGILNKSKKWVMKLSVCGETEEFIQRKGSGRSFNLSSRKSKGGLSNINEISKTVKAPYNKQFKAF